MGKDEADNVSCHLHRHDFRSIGSSSENTTPAVPENRSVPVMVDEVTTAQQTMISRVEGRDLGPAGHMFSKTDPIRGQPVPKDNTSTAGTSDVSYESGYATCENGNTYIPDVFQRDTQCATDNSEQKDIFLDFGIRKKDIHLPEQLPHDIDNFYGDTLSSVGATVSIVRPSISGVVSADSPYQTTSSPRRSPSPYSCGMVSDFREPGNISSKNCQENWSIASGKGQSRRSSPRDAMSDDSDTSSDISTVLDPSGESMRNLFRIERSSSCEIFVCEPSDKDSRTNSSPFDSVKVGKENILSIKVNCQRNSLKSNGDPHAVTAEGPKPLTLFRNDCYIKVSHCLLDGHQEKRVVDVRTVADLMEVYRSLKQPVIIPYPRQHSYYDQWARFPRGDVTSRIYPRSNSNLSVKCWTLYQAIQNEQIKANVTAINSPAKVVVPNPADVSCKSLASIIEHYNQLSILQSPVFTAPAKSNPSATLKAVVPKDTIGQGNNNHHSSKTSHDRGRNRANNVCSQGANDKMNTNQSRDKTSPLPIRKKTSLNVSKHNGSKNNDGDSDAFSEYNDTKDDQGRGRNKHSDNTCDKKRHKNDIDAGPKVQRSHTLLPSHKTQSAVKTSPMQLSPVTPRQRSCSETSIPTAGLFSSCDLAKGSDETQQGSSSTRDHHQQTLSRCNSSVSCPEDAPSCSRDKRSTPSPSSVTITVRDVDAMADAPTELAPNVKTPMDRRNGSLLTREPIRNPYDVTTSTIRLRLPHEMLEDMRELNTSTSSLHLAEKRPHNYYQNPNPAGLNGYPRRSKTRLCFSHMAKNTDRLEMKRMATSLNPQQLRQSLLINELQCRDMEDSKHPPERSVRRHDRSKSSPLRGSAKPPELPTRMFNVYDRLEPCDHQLPLSPEMHRPRSARQPTVSLANVHFLDLSDLKQMLRKTNTPIPRL